MSDALSTCRVPLSYTTNIPSNNNAIAASDTIATNNAVVQMAGNKLIINRKI
jgi:capsid portal protein